VLVPQWVSVLDDGVGDEEEAATLLAARTGETLFMS